MLFGTGSSSVEIDSGERTCELGVFKVQVQYKKGRDIAHSLGRLFYIDGEIKYRLWDSDNILKPKDQ